MLPPVIKRTPQRIWSTHVTQFRNSLEKSPLTIPRFKGSESMNNGRWPPSAGAHLVPGSITLPSLESRGGSSILIEGIGDLHRTAVLGSQWCASDGIPLTPWSKRKEGESFWILYSGDRTYKTPWSTWHFCFQW